MDRVSFIERLGASEAGEAAVEVAEPEPLPADASLFWKTTGNVPEVHIPLSPPKVHAALPERLGAPPFWRGKEDFAETMAAIYETAAYRVEVTHHEFEESGGKR